MGRTALLIRCGVEDARMIREGAERERRTVSGYLLNILDRALRFEETLFERIPRLAAMNRILSRKPKSIAGPQTAILLRCSEYEAERIRMAAKRREVSISAFVRLTLHAAWRARDGITSPPR
jgi:uncharacterized protein (DUF1778 family)